jgi:hypothetical protein
MRRGGIRNQFCKQREAQCSHMKKTEYLKCNWQLMKCHNSLHLTYKQGLIIAAVTPNLPATEKWAQQKFWAVTVKYFTPLCENCNNVQWLQFTTKHSINWYSNNSLVSINQHSNASENQKMHEYLICVCHKMLILHWHKMLNHMKCYNSSWYLNKWWCRGHDLTTVHSMCHQFLVLPLLHKLSQQGGYEGVLLSP